MRPGLRSSYRAWVATPLGAALNIVIPAAVAVGCVLLVTEPSGWYLAGVAAGAGAIATFHAARGRRAAPGPLEALLESETAANAVVGGALLISSVGIAAVHAVAGLAIAALGLGLLVHALIRRRRDG